LRARLDAATQAVEDASEEFETAAAVQATHVIAREALVGGNVTRVEMEKVYTQRMAKKGAPGRDIYDELISAPAHGRCPLCGYRLVTTLDHHLPKAHYPALAVTPLNLVPSCGDCNKAKLDVIPRQAAEVSLHPYFDNIDNECWLRAEVIETRPAALRFYVAARIGWGAVLRLRVLNHFSVFGLAELYACVAAEELFNIRRTLVDLHAAAGREAVRLDLEGTASSCAGARRNGWRTAAYEAWATCDWFCDGGFAFEG
jgi:hypothetical protein